VCSFILSSWRYAWSLDEAKKNVLRTHTTSVSSRTLYKIAQGGFKPGKYFSIDRVYRNETLDKTHLAEFYQIEGFIVDRDLNLGHLMGIIRTFFEKAGRCFFSFFFLGVGSPRSLFSSLSFAVFCLYSLYASWVSGLWSLVSVYANFLHSN
jgi:tRNA synthetases class II core domain (F)